MLSTHSGLKGQHECCPPSGPSKSVLDGQDLKKKKNSSKGRLFTGIVFFYFKSGPLIVKMDGLNEDTTPMLTSNLWGQDSRNLWGQSVQGFVQWLVEVSVDGLNTSYKKCIYVHLHRSELIHIQLSSIHFNIIIRTGRVDHHFEREKNIWLVNNHMIGCHLSSSANCWV